MGKALSVFVNIGARLLPSLGSAANSVEQRFAKMNRGLRRSAIETKLAYRDLMTSMKPIAGMAVAGGLTFGLKSSLGAGNAFAHEVVMLRVAGRSVAEVSQAIAQSNRTLRDIPTSTLTDNLRIINETTGAYGSFKHALENLSFNSKLGYSMTNLLGTDAGEVPHALNSIIQALEIRGSAMNPRSYQSDVGELFRAMVFTRGRFNADEFRGFASTGNLPLKQFNQRFMTRILPSLITELGGGDTVGTMASAFRNQLMGNVPIGGKKMVAEWVRLGLVPRAGTGGNLSRTGWTAGTVKGHTLAMSDPFAWVERVLLPAMKARGINTDDSNAVLLQTTKMFGRETARRFVATMIDPRQRARLHKDEGMIGKSMPLEQSFKLMLATDPNAAMAKTMASVTRLETTLGRLATPAIIQGLGNLANSINWLAGVFERHPNFGKGLLALMGVGAIAGAFAAFDAVLRIIMLPFGAFLGFLSRAVGILPLAGNLIAAFARTSLFQGFVNILARLGPLLWRGLLLVGPWLLRGLAAAFGLLSNPVGWAILAASAALIIWRYRDAIAKAWTVVTTWFRGAWNGVIAYVKTINWRAVGMFIADGLTFGLASKLANSQWGSLISRYVGGSGSPGAAAGKVIDGKRAWGGSIWSGKSYLVGERGPEIVTPRRNAYVHPAGSRPPGPWDAPASSAPPREPSGGVHVGKLNIYGAQDPEAVARAVRRELAKLARGNAALLSD